MRISVVILVSCLLATCPLVGLVSTADAQIAPVINEFVNNHTGTDTYEFVEVFGEPNTDMSRYWVIGIEGDGAGAGTLDNVFRLTSTDSAGFWTTAFMSNELENGTLTYLLVMDLAASEGEDLDQDNDGVIDWTAWGVVADGVAVSDGDASDITYTDVVLDPFFDGDPFAPGGASRIPNGLDTDTVGDWVRNDFDGAGLPGFMGEPSPGRAFNTPNAVNMIPEPGTLLLAGLGVLALALGKRR